MDHIITLMSFEEFTKVLADAVFGLPLTLLLLATGIYFSFRTKFVQIRKIKVMFKLLFSSKVSNKGISTFQAFSIALAGRVGTGNIAGVATAIALGGPGALFWMWVLTIFGASTAYVEATLAQIYKKEVDGEYRGGPAYYFEKISGKRVFGVIFAIITIVSMGLLLPGSQSSSIANAIQQAFFADVSNVTLVRVLIGVSVVILLAIIIVGGTKRLSHVTQVIVPIMSFAYVIFALIIIIANITMLPEIFAMIFKYAFNPIAGLGGVMGHAVLNGVKRGIYSNEAGRGSGPHAAAAAAVKHPAEQGLVQAFSVYIDTLLICTATGLIILITGSYYLQTSAGSALSGSTAVYGGLSNSIAVGPAFTQEAISSLLGQNIGYKFVAIALFFFAFTTLLAYYYMAETNVAYLTAKRDKNGVLKSNKALVQIVRIVFFAVVIIFTNSTATEVFNLADVGTGLMSWYNVIGILIVSIPAFKALKDYEKQLKAGNKEPSFDPQALNIKNTEVW